MTRASGPGSWAHRTPFWLALIVCLSCASPDFTTPDYSTRGWWEAEVEGIRVLTNTRPAIARRSLVKLSRFLRLAHAVGGYELPQDPVGLHLFDRTAQYNAFSGPGYIGHMINGGKGFYLALGVDRPEITTRTLFHEVVHLLLESDDAAAPSWYHEGLAEFLGSAILRPGVATLGRPLRGRVETLRTRRPMGLANLFSTRTPSLLSPDAQSLFYAEAWAFVHFAKVSVVSGQRALQLDRFVELLSVGKSPPGAFATAFGASVGRVERTYLRHRKQLTEGDEVLYRHFVIDGEDPEIVFRSADPVEVSRDLAAHAIALDRPGTALPHLEEVLRSNPRDSEALLAKASILAAGRQWQSADELVGSIPEKSSHSAEGHGMLQLARFGASREASGEENEGPDANELALLEGARTAYERAVAGAPDCRGCWLGIAFYHSVHPEGDASAGLKALSHAGSSFDANLLRGRLLMRVGRFDEAQRVAQRLVATTHWPEQARKARALEVEIVRSRSRPRSRPRSESGRSAAAG